MNQYLVQWASGAFQIVTAEQLRKDLDEYETAPPRIYRLIPDNPPERLWVIRMKGAWMIGDMYRNMIEL
jgi:hypothetical protein